MTDRDAIEKFLLLTEDLLIPKNIDIIAFERHELLLKFITKISNDYQVDYEKPILASIHDYGLKLSKLYFYTIYAHLKPTVAERINRYKMASVMELLIVKEQIFYIDGAEEAENRELNAFIGMMSAISIVNSMIFFESSERRFIADTINVEINNNIEISLENHYRWLKSKELNDLPINLDAQYYELVTTLSSASYLIHN